MKRWQLILNTVVDIATYLNEDVEETVKTTTPTKQKKEVKETSDNNDEIDHMDLKVLSDIVKEQESMQKQTEEEKKIMQEFLNSLSPDD